MSSCWPLYSASPPGLRRIVKARRIIGSPPGAASAMRPARHRGGRPVLMAWSRPWSSISPAGGLDGEAAPVEDEDAIGEADDLGQLGRTEEDRPAAVGEFADQPVDLALGADVDAARRVVEQEHGRARPRATCRRRPSAGCRPTAARRWRPGPSVRMRRPSIWRGARGPHRARGPATAGGAAGRRRRRGRCSPRRSRSSIRPWLRRSAGTRLMPRRAAAVGEAGGAGPSAIRDGPAGRPCGSRRGRRAASRRRSPRGRPGR